MFTASDSDGQSVKVVVPVGEWVMRGIQDTAGQHRRAERQARKEVARALQEFVFVNVQRALSGRSSPCAKQTKGAY
jgi:hypothetical protein